MILLVMAAGAVGGFFFLSATGSTINIGEMADSLISYFRRFWQTAESAVVGTVSDDAIEKALGIVAEFEGFSAHAYPDSDGFSIGYGHFIQPSDPWDSSSVISESEAWDLLHQDIQASYNCVVSNVTVTLNSNQIAALTSFVYNVGCSAFKGSTLLKDVNAANFNLAAQQFAVWNLSQGSILDSLISRRAKEMELFNA